MMNIVGRWTRTVAACALVSCATLAAAVGLMAVTAPPAAAAGASTLGVYIGQVSLSVGGSDSANVSIQLNDSSAIYSAAIHVGTPDKYDPAPLVTLNDVVHGVSDTAVKVSSNTFGPFGVVLVVTKELDGRIVAGIADMAGWASPDGRGRWAPCPTGRWGVRQV